MWSHEDLPVSYQGIAFFILQDAWLPQHVSWYDGFRASIWALHEQYARNDEYPGTTLPHGWKHAEQQQW